MPPEVGNMRERLCSELSIMRSGAMPAFFIIAFISSNVMAASTMAMAASSFLERQGPINTVFAPG